MGTGAALLGGGLAATGFTSAGVALGSIAAGVQSGLGVVGAGSAFAALQSLGATGLIAATGVAGLVVGATALAGYGVYKLINHWKNKADDPIILLLI